MIQQGAPADGLACASLKIGMVSRESDGRYVIESSGACPL